MVKFFPICYETSFFYSSQYCKIYVSNINVTRRRISEVGDVVDKWMALEEKSRAQGGWYHSQFQGTSLTTIAQLGNSRSPGHPFNCLQGDPNLGSSRLSGPAIVQIRPRIVFVMQVKRQKLEDYYFTWNDSCREWNETIERWDK